MAKVWKQILIVILVIACLVNIMLKLTTKVRISDEIKLSANHFKENVQNTITNVGNTIQDKVEEALNVK